jgi:hypothetical protein
MNGNKQSHGRPPNRGQWIFLLIAAIVSVAPFGLILKFRLTNRYQDFHGLFLAGFWVLFAGLWIGSYSISGRGFRTLFLIIAWVTVILNISGCAIAWRDAGRGPW